MHKRICLIAFFFSLFSINGFAQSQYFGQNKPRYRPFNFKVLQSPHFELYNYFQDRKVADQLLVNSENWYNLHQEVFKLAFIKPNPLIIYKTHPDFQETTAIGGQIGEGTGGVTEGLRNRVVMPMMYSKRQTDHVLGHELVHAFQYQTMINGSDSTSLANIQNLPLFMVEGLAEYMSLGRVDAHTAMWMRDAVLSNDIPTIKELVTKEYKYFPYRWGQAFWAYVTATYGDDVIRPLFKETAIYGLEAAFIRTFKMDIDRFSVKFKNELIQTYNPLKNGKVTEGIGKVIASQKTGAEMNVSPAISPNGNYIAYISSKNVLSLDIFIADARSGKIVRKIESASFGAHVDSYSFIETSGTWSPDSRNFAIVVQTKGHNKLMVIDVESGSRKSYSLKDIPAFTNPAWSPDGGSIVVSGLVEGTSDLYLLNLKTDEVKNLTSDNYSDFQPAWSPDGQWIYFVSDRGSDKQRLEKADFTISRINPTSGEIKTFGFFKGADNMNPAVSPDGKSFFFLSDRDGFRNLYKFNIEEQVIFQLTDYFTGISGITMYSPAISVSAKSGDIVYTYFKNGDYNIVNAAESDFNAVKVKDEVNKTGALLPPSQWVGGRDIVQNNLNRENLVIKNNASAYKDQKYDARFKLDYLANSGLDVSTSRFGTGVGGGITGLFSDMLNNHQLIGTVALNGELQDFGGQVFYLNQKRPFQWGASFSHIPYQFYGGTSYDLKDSLGSANGLTYFNGLVKQRINRVFIDEISLFAFKPFNTYKRVEFGTSLNWYSFSVREYSQEGDIGVGANGYVYDFVPRISYKPTKLDPADYGLNPFKLNQVYAAYVGDNATFGTVAPLKGYRFRLEVAKYFGTSSYNSVMIDLRKYQFIKPFTLAGRVMYNGRLNPSNLEFLNQINPLYLGYPWYMHGFFGRAMQKQIDMGTITQDALQGEQLALTNIELRLPFTGPKKLALIEFNYLPSDLNFFVDAGMIWSENKKIGETYVFNAFGNSPLDFKINPVISTGVSLRINVLGYLIVEPYVAIPFYNGKKQSSVTGVNFMVPGW
jgi:Tol biopolymer transport system component